MKSFLALCLIAVCGAFAPTSTFTANTMAATRGSSMLSMNAAEKTYIMVRALSYYWIIIFFLSNILPVSH